MGKLPQKNIIIMTKIKRKAPNAFLDKNKGKTQGIFA